MRAHQPAPARWDGYWEGIEHRHIFDSRFLLNFQNRWIWQTNLSQCISFFFSKER